MSALAIRLSEMIGLTILHSLWQITLLWMVLVAVLRLWPKASSAIRYTLALSTLILSVLTTAATTVYEWQQHATSEEISSLTNDSTQAIQIVYITVKQTLLSRIADLLDTSVPILAWLWCGGLVVMGARFGGSFFYLRTLRAQKNIAAISPVWEQELKRLSAALSLRCEVAIASSARISSPLTLGSISPIILLPAGLLSGLSTAQVEAILVHELYHIKRRDYIINICQALVEVLLFYHPAIWHINNIIREERENCCDDQTLAFCGDAITYARALTQIQEINTLTKPTLAMSASGHNAGNFSNRIKRLFNIYPNPAQARSKGIFAIGFLIVYLGIVLAGANLSAAQPVEPEKKSLGANVDNHNTFSNIPTDSVPVYKKRYVRDEKAVMRQQVRSVIVKKIHTTDIQRADTTVQERNLDKCLQQVRLLLKMVPTYRLSSERFKFSAFPAADSLQMANSTGHLATTFLKLRSTRLHGTVNLSRTNKLSLTDTTRHNTIKKLLLEKLYRAAADSVAFYNGKQAMERDEDGKEEKDVAVQVFPNATNDYLNISFTPVHNGSHIKMVLIDSDGKVVKEITDATYNSTPARLLVDVSSYKKGIYILQINIDGTKSQQRVVVE